MDLPYGLPSIPQGIIDKVFFTAAAFLVASIVSAILKNSFRFFRRSIQNRHFIPMSFVGKTNTINSILFSLIDSIVFAITFLIVLSRWEVDISPILTGAGIVGIAITFGSQALVKDIISGFFLIAENQFNVGDFVRIDKDKFEGKVIRVTLRITVLKDANENKIFIPNSSITSVTLLKNAAFTPPEKEDKKSEKSSKKK